MRPVVVHVRARDAIRMFPREIRDRLAKALLLLQFGEQLRAPLVTFYFSASAKGILVIHAFVKKSRKTPLAEIELAKKRLHEMRDDEE